MNEAFLKGCGRRREELVGRSLFHAFAGDPDDDDSGEHALRASIAEAIASGQPQTMPAQRYPILIKQGDAKPRYEERFWSAVTVPVLDAEGRLLCLSHSTTDVTELMRSEALIRDSEIRFRALINASSDVIYRMSPDWKFMYELDGRGFLKTTTRLAEYHIEDYVYPDDLDLARGAIAQAIRDKTMFELEHRVLRADGSHGWTYSKAVPILDEVGEIREWIGMASDITERKLAEEQLKDASKRKDEFLAMLAHELRNPLAPIKAASQLLQLRALDPERIRETSRIVERQVAHMTNLVDELLDVSRVSRNLVKLDCTTLDIGQVLRDAVEQVAPLIQSLRHRLRLRLDSGREALYVLGDAKRLVQTVANLLNNAAKFTPAGGSIALTAAAEGDRVRIDVTDDGIGMTLETAEHAFELFSQAERSADRSQGGLGLGLALVRTLVGLHGGTVSCASGGLDQGSRFTVLLPRLAGGAGREQAADVVRERGTPDRLRILVVDDNEDAAAMLSMLLESMGYQVLVEHGSMAALAQARQDPAPDVYVLDIGLPDIDGNELARRLRADPRNGGAVMIALTGYGRDSDRLRSLEAGFDHHLVKPVDIDKLGQILAALRH